MANGQAAIAGQLPTLLGGLYERVADVSQRRRVIGAMRVARWWVIACDRVDKAEAAIAPGGVEPVCWNARELDLDLRTVRNKLAVHLGTVSDA